MGLRTTSALLLVLVLVIWQFLVRTSLKPHLEGTVAQGWEGVEEAFRRSVASGLEQGATFAVYHKGALVVDLAGGYADDEAELPMATDSLQAMASVVKALSAVCIALLVDRGHLSYEKPVSYYWPEFAENGKAGITVEQLLSHQGGLAVLDEQFDFIDDSYDEIIAALAKQPPHWIPGKEVGYHTFTMMPLMHQLIKLADPEHRDLGRFFKEEIGDELGLDIFYGLPDSEFPRFARVYQPSVASLDLLVATRYWPLMWALHTDKSSMTYRSLTNPARCAGGSRNHPDLKRHPMVGSATARAVAHLMGALANGGDHAGSAVLTPEAVRRLERPLAVGMDNVLLSNTTYGPGVTLRKTPSRGWMVGAPGAGGQMGYFDREAKLGWGYLRNHHSIGDDPNYLRLETAMYETVRQLETKT